MLLHLNGPPGIGKSTLARLYTQRHPGTLNVDIDALHQFLSGWEGSGDHAHEILRPVAKAMVGAHLAGGRDVVLPQYLARVEEIEAFEQIARRHGARFVEIVLRADREEAVSRFSGRPAVDEWDRHNRDVVERLGGDAFLAEMYHNLADVLDARPNAVVVPAAEGATEETYQAILANLREGV